MKLTAEMVEDWRTAWANDGLKPEVFAQLNAIADAALRGLAGEWVPVGERLPERGSFVLVAWRNSKCPLAVAKFTGKRWLDPHAWDNSTEEFSAPECWRTIPPVEPRSQPATESP